VNFIFFPGIKINHGTECLFIQARDAFLHGSQTLSLACPMTRRFYAASSIHHASFMVFSGRAHYFCSNPATHACSGRHGRVACAPVYHRRNIRADKLGHRNHANMSAWNRIAAAFVIAANMACSPLSAAADFGEGDDRIASQSELDALMQQVTLLRNVRYGNDDRQTMDVYLPRAARPGMPVIFMVHGGAWRFGDKTARSVVLNKAARWVPRGFIFVSVNYRMLPDADPLRQAEDVAQALATAQDKAAAQGGDPDKFILMGHSAGAHLVDLLDANPDLALKAGARPWLGTVSLDSGALDVARIMNARHLRLYDRAFGNDPAYWRTVSPTQALTAAARPILLVCSTRRADSCPQARDFSARASSLGVHAEVLGENLPHREINATLGEPGAYTESVERFMGGLDPAVKRALSTSVTTRQ
jgi:arylformamidase